MEFRILGTLEVGGGGQGSLGGAKQRALLVLLLLRAGELVPTDRLVEELWGGAPPATATKTVQVYVSQLRKALGRDLLETRGPGYVLRTPRETVDVHRFEDLLAEGRRLLAAGDAAGAARALDEALGLWRGSALAEFQYEPFAQSEIARLEELRLVARELRLEARLALGQHAEAVPELEALVRAHPLRESLRRLLMLALYRGGRQADALAAYQDARTALVEELGLEPGQALQQLEQAILRQDPALDPARRETEPPAPAPLHMPATALPHRAGEVRKTVTLLFCDVVQSTRLGEELDAESLRAVLGRFLAEATAVVERHGGAVEHQAGDGLMAVFGVPIVREDDALRAAHAAVEVREAVAEKLPQLELRIGLNTGEVVSGDGFVTGDAVNVAKRLEELAAPGEILLGATTYALVAHAVTGQLLGPVALKGKSEPHLPFRLDGVDADARAYARRDDTPLVGRTTELGRLLDLFDDVEAGCGARLVTVVGDAGIGKSRLVREALEAIGARATVRIGRCPPYGEGVTYLPLRGLLGDPATLGQTSHEIFAATRGLLAELAAERPLVAVFEDVHWAEPTFLDLVEYLHGRLGAARVLLVCLTRPELVEQRPVWLQEPAVALTLQPLAPHEAEQLLDALDAPAAVRARVAQAAEGNPLFVEQLAALALDEHELPSSVRGVLTERIDRLPEDARAVLERAAVVGRSFAVEQVLSLCPHDLAERAHPLLLGLVRRRLLRPDPELADGFRFQHALIRDAAYEALPKATRAALHERVADLVADDALQGFHLERAVAYRRDLGATAAETAFVSRRASQLLAAAGRAAFASGDVAAAVSLLGRAAALVRDDDPDRPALLTELGAAMIKASRFAEAREPLEAAVAAAAQQGRRDVELRAMLELQFLLSFTAPHEAATENVRVSEQLIPELEQLRDDLGLASAWWLRSEADAIACRWQARAEALERALEHALRAPSARQQASQIRAMLAQALHYGPMPVSDAVERCEELLAAAESDRALCAALTCTLAGLRAMLGEVDEARRLYAEAVATYDELGLRFRRHARAIVGGQIEALAGDPARAERELRSAYDALGAAGERGVWSVVAAMLADVHCAQGRFVDAEPLAREVAAEAGPMDVMAQVLWRSTLARVLAQRAEEPEAERLLAEARALTDAADFPDLRAGILVASAEVADMTGRMGEARRLLRDARSLYAAKGNVAAVAAVDSRLTHIVA